MNNFVLCLVSKKAWLTWLIFDWLIHQTYCRHYISLIYNTHKERKRYKDKSNSQKTYLPVFLFIFFAWRKFKSGFNIFLKFFFFIVLGRKIINTSFFKGTKICYAEMFFMLVWKNIFLGFWWFVQIPKCFFWSKLCIFALMWKCLYVVVSLCGCVDMWLHRVMFCQMRYCRVMTCLVILRCRL